MKARSTGCAIAAFALIASCVTPPEVQRQAQEPRSGVFADILDEFDTPGAGGAVIKGGEIAFLGVDGVRKAGTNTPVQVNDAFHIGSDTKAMTAMLAAILVDERRIRWNSTVGEVLGGVLPFDPRYKNITLTQLLSHTAVIPGGMTAEVWNTFFAPKAGVVEERRRMAGEALRQPPLFDTGTGFFYSNMGYVVAGAMLETAAARSWEEMMTERLFKPLGMISAGFGAPATANGIDAPWGHTTVPVPPGMMADNPEAMGPAGTVHASLGDMAKWLSFIMNEGVTLEGKRLVSKKSLEFMFTEVMRGYALGWGVAKGAGGELVAFHDGSNTMFYSTILMIPERKYAVIAMVNRGDGKGAQAAAAVRDMLVAKYAP